MCVKIFLCYFLFLTFFTFLLFGLDKSRARNGYSRIPEVRLFFLALLGGSVGALLGMYVFRHKTRHFRFTAGIPLLLMSQIALFLFLICHF